MTNPNNNPKKQSLKEWAMAGGGVPREYEGRAYEWHKKVQQFAAGGGIKPAAYIDGNEFVEAAQAYGLKTDNATLNKIVDRVNKGESVREAAKNVAESHAAGGEIFNTVPDMKDGGQIIDGPAYQKGGVVKKAVKDAVEGVVEGLKPTVDRINMHFKDVTKRVPELQEGAQKIQGDEMTRAEYEKLVKKYKPVKPYEFVPKPASRDEAVNALTADKRDLYGAPSGMLQAGDPVGLRLDIPAYSDHGVWVPAVHRQASGFGAGDRIGYESVAGVTNPTFGMSEKAALSIAAGKPKGTIATIKGNWNPMDEKRAVARAQEYLDNPDWVQVGMDPERHGYFYDRRTMQPITGAEEAIQIGPLVLAKKPQYGNKKDFKYAHGGEVHMDKGGDPRGEMKAFDPTVRERMADALQRGMEKLGANRYKARRNAQTVMGGASSALPIGVGAADFVPFLGTGLGVDEGVRDLGLAYDAAKSGDYTGAIANTAGAAAGLIPGAYGTVKAGKSAAKGALSAARSAEKYAEKAVPKIMERGGMGAEMLGALGSGTRSNVIKPKGGNWLTGSVENALSPLRPDMLSGQSAERVLERMRETYTPSVLKNASPGVRQNVIEGIEHLERKVALNKWVDSNLANYVKKEMGTADDPVRKLAEEGIVHMPSQNVGINRYKAPEHREKFGGQQLGKSLEAQAWEDAADVAIKPAKIGDLQGGYREPWMDKASPDTPISHLSGVFDNQGLGFDHIMDVLRQDLDAGRIRPEQLNKVSMEQAVRRTYDFDQEMAQKMRDSQLRVTEGMPTYKEYPEGYKWVQLAPPKELPSGYSTILDDVTGSYKVVDDKGKEAFPRKANDLGHINVPFFKTPDEAIADALKRDPRLEEALKYEGNTMGHCVGGYCDDVREGKSKIYSLRDAKGEPHVTIETAPSPYAIRWEVVKPYLEAAKEEAIKLPNGYTSTDIADIAIRMAKENEPDRIVQIKGKQNAKPKEAYLPYVQDFVRGGKWGDIGDLKNTDLYKADPDELGMYLPKDPRLQNMPGRRSEDFHKAKQAGLFGDKQYLTRDEWEEILRKQIESESGPLPPLQPDEGMAKGGKVVKEAVELGIEEVKKLLGMAKEAPKGVEPIVVKPSERAAAGRKAAELIKSQPQIKASEALGRMKEKGFKKTTTTQADRTRVGGGNIGGAPFSAISEADPLYAGKVWGVMDEGTASRLINLTDPETAWTTMLGSADQLKTNPIVFDKLKKQFLESMKAGNLSPELEAKINHNLALNFGEGAQIRDPKIWKEADTFEKRAALADLMMGQGIPPSKGGLALGGEKSGKGVIFRPTDTLIRETEPYLLHSEHGGDVPTFAAGPRLFSLDKSSTYRPDLHPGFPTLLEGKDLGVNMLPTPTEIYLPDWHRAFKQKKPERFHGPWAEDIIARRKSGSYKLGGAEGPGYYDLALGLKNEGLPSQDLTDDYIRHLIREGFKAGGAVGGLSRVTKSCDCHD